MDFQTVEQTLSAGRPVVVLQPAGEDSAVIKEPVYAVRELPDTIPAKCRARMPEAFQVLVNYAGFPAWMQVTSGSVEAA